MIAAVRHTPGLSRDTGDPTIPAMSAETRSTARFRRPTLAAVAAGRHDVVSSSELLATGVSEEQIRHLVAIGFLHRIHRGVYAVGRPQLAPRGRHRAAWLACGPASAISHDSALADWNLARSAGWVHVSARHARDRRGLVIHRPRSLAAEDVTVREGYAVTTVARTILDMAPRRPVDVVGRWLHEAGVQGVLDRSAFWRVLERHPHHRGARVLEAALATEFVVTRSALEDAWLAISRRAGMPEPVGNDTVWTEIGEEEVDFHYPPLNLVVEVDSIRYHSSRWRRRRDAAKSERLVRAGLRVRRVHELEITLDADGLVARLRAFTATRGGRNPSDRPVSPTTA